MADQCNKTTAYYNMPRDRVALALFVAVYEGTGDDYREFAAQLWRELPAAKRRLWYHQADVALEALNA